MATRTVTALFDRYEDAAEAVRQLEAAGVPHDDIAIVSNDAAHVRFHDAMPGVGVPAEDHHVSGAGTGASVGTLLGGGAGLLAGLGLLAIPGLGPVVAAGWLAATLVGAGVGAAAGGIVGSLTDEGMSESDATAYAEGLHRGGTLVTARAAGLMIEPVTDILDRNGTVDLSLRAPALNEGVIPAAAGPAPEIPPVGDPALAAAGLLPEAEAEDASASPDPSRSHALEGEDVGAKLPAGRIVTLTGRPRLLEP